MDGSSAALAFAGRIRRVENRLCVRLESLPYHRLRRCQGIKSGFQVETGVDAAGVGLEFAPSFPLTQVMRIIFIGSLLVTATGVFGQSISPPPVEWQATFGAEVDDDLQSVNEAPGGGYLFAGSSNGSTNATKTSVGFGGVDFWIVRTDAAGTRVWDKSFGGTDNDFLRDLQMTSGGGFLAGGHSSSTNGNKTSPLWGSGPAGLGDYWIVRADTNGNVLWDKSFGGTNDDVLFGVRQTMDGGYVLGGYSVSAPSGNKTAAQYGGSDFWVVRLDAVGDVVWDRSFGGDSADVLYTLQETTNGGFILGGFTTSGISGNKTSPGFGNEDAWVIRLDASGNKVWESSLGGAGRDGCFAVQELSDGGFIVGGYSASAAGTGNKASPNYGAADFWIVRLDANGNKVWDQSYGGSGDDQLLDLRVTAGGGLFVGGYSYSRANGNKSSPNFTPSDPTSADYWLLRLDASGGKVWEQVFGGTGLDRLESLAMTVDAGLILGGNSTSVTNGNKTTLNYGFADYWILKLGPDALSVPPRLRTAPQSSSQIRTSGFRFYLQGLSNVAYVVDYRQASPTWVPLVTNTLQSAEVQLMDPGATNVSSRLYRARLAP